MTIIQLLLLFSVYLLLSMRKPVYSNQSNHCVMMHVSADLVRQTNLTCPDGVDEPTDCNSVNQTDNHVLHLNEPPFKPPFYESRFMQDTFAWTPLLHPLGGDLSVVVSAALDMYFSAKFSRAQRALWRVELKKALEGPQTVRQPPLLHSSEYLTGVMLVQ